MQAPELCGSLQEVCSLPSACFHQGLGTHRHEKWPDLELYLRMTKSKEQLFNDIFLRSLRMFWPADQVRLLIVLDDENEADHEWGPQLQMQLSSYDFASVRVSYEGPADNVYGSGHDRQQWSMFSADNHTISEYVGFVDTDTLFTTRVHPGDLFECERPVVHGLVGKQTDDWWNATASATVAALGRPQIMRGMNYFPVVMKVQHLKHLREHITEQMKTQTFDQAFKRISSEHWPFSQFSIMASFVYLRHQCEYSFALEELEPAFRENIPGHTKCLDSILDEKTTFPRIKIAVHYRYIKDPAPISAYLLEGYCRSEALLASGEKQYAAQCSKFVSPFLQENLFVFEFHSWTWNSLCRRAQNKHYTSVESAERIWPAELLAEVMSNAIV